jgi:hypothetical protein
VVDKRVINMIAEAAYDGICARAMKMAEEALSPMNSTQRVLVEAAIAAGVTATITTFNEAGLLKHGSG